MKSLEGVKVIEVGGTVAMPLAGTLLASWGAEVIHVEPPQIGDMLRYLSSQLLSEEANPRNVNYLWEHVSRNKKSIAVDLRSAEGQKIIHTLSADADVFMNNLRPYEIEKFNLSYKVLSGINPRIVYGNLTGYGKDGPEKNAGGYDSVAFWARSGVMELLRKEEDAPVVSRPAYGDSITSLSLAAGIMSALFIRERTGEGQEVSVSLFNTALWVLGFDIAGTLISEMNPQRTIAQMASNPLRSVYRTKDCRWIMLGMTNAQPYWPSFCNAIGRQDLADNPKYSTSEERASHAKDLIDIIQRVFAEMTYEEWKSTLKRYKLIWSPVQFPLEVIEDRQALANDMFVEWEHPEHGIVKMISNPIKLSKTHAHIPRKAPDLGENTDEIMKRQGYSDSEIARMKNEGIIG